ncbi:MAG: LptF/LptG family permease [Gemmatimonadetes bacterium]|nr:LptF/LptG family permease [Gemmatimonadota bacterium]
MIRILDRLVATTFTVRFLLFVTCVPVIFVLSDLNERQDQFIDRGLGVGEITLGYLFQIPHFIVWASPIAALIATVFTVHSMTIHREIQAAKAGGISFHRLVFPVLPAGILMTGGAFLLSTAVPTMNRRAAEILGDRESYGDLRTEFVHQLESGATLSIQQLFNWSLTGVTFERRAEDRTLHHLWAREGAYTEADGWTLQAGKLRIVRPDQSETTYTFEQYRGQVLDVPPEELLDDPPNDQELGYRELGQRAEALRRSGGNPDKLLVRRAQKLSIPAATLVIVLFGAPLATTVRKGGPAVGVGLSLSSTVLYLMMLRLFEAIGASGGLSPFWAAWSPNFFFLAVGIVLLWRVRT